MTELDAEGHVAYLNGRALPGLCHCAANEAHDAEPTAPAPGEAYGFTAPPPDCPYTDSPQFDRPDLDMCACGHRHVKVEVWRSGDSGD